MRSSCSTTGARSPTGRRRRWPTIPRSFRLILAEMAVLKLESVSTHYDGVQALWGVSLEVEEGAVVALIGGNGAGKTTLLRTISRLLPVSEGSITLSGRDLLN